MRRCSKTLITLVVVLFWTAATRAQSSEASQPLDPAADVAARSGRSLANASFEDGALGEAPPGWKVRSSPGYEVVVSSDEPAGGRKCAAIALPPGQSPGYANVIQRIDPSEFRGKRVCLRGAVRADVVGPDNRVFMWFRVDRRDKDGTRRQGAFDNMWDRPITSNQWQYYDIVGDVDDDATDITCGLFLRGRGQAWFDDVSLEIVGDDVAVTAGRGGALAGTPVDEIKPGLFEVVSSSRFAPYETPWSRLRGLFGTSEPNPPQTMLLPLPLSYRDQVPIGFQLVVKPPGAVTSIDVFQDQGDNYVLKLVVDDVAQHKQVDIKFTSLVLVGPSVFDEIPSTASVPDNWPAEAKPWLAATWCADASHPRIQAAAKKIRDETDNVRQIIKEVEQQAGTIFGAATGQVNNLTAVEALDKQGSCTSCANLVAALLRASNVPARIVAGYPSWTGPLQTHYIVEAYVPGCGWYPIESTRCESPWPNTHQVNVAIIPPEYEEESKAGLRFGIAGGVPYLSLTEMPDNAGSILKWGTIEEGRNCDHECRMVRALAGETGLWHGTIAQARVRWHKWLTIDHELDASGELEFGVTADEISSTEINELIPELER